MPQAAALRPLGTGANDLREISPGIVQLQRLWIVSGSSLSFYLSDSLSLSLSQFLRSSTHFFFTYSLRQILKIYLTLDPINKNRLTLNDPQFILCLNIQILKNCIQFSSLSSSSSSFLLFFFLRSCFFSSSCSTLLHCRATIWQEFSQMHHWMHGVFEG